MEARSKSRSKSSETEAASSRIDEATNALLGLGSSSQSTICSTRSSETEAASSRIDEATNALLGLGSSSHSSPEDSVEDKKGNNNLPPKASGLFATTKIVQSGRLHLPPIGNVNTRSSGLFKRSNQNPPGQDEPEINQSSDSQVIGPNDQADGSQPSPSLQHLQQIEPVDQDNNETEQLDSGSDAPDIALVDHISPPDSGVVAPVNPDNKTQLPNGQVGAVNNSLTLPNAERVIRRLTVKVHKLSEVDITAFTHQPPDDPHIGTKKPQTKKLLSSTHAVHGSGRSVGARSLNSSNRRQKPVLRYAPWLRPLMEKYDKQEPLVKSNEEKFHLAHKLWSDVKRELDVTCAQSNYFHPKIWGKYFHNAKVPESTKTKLSGNGDGIRKAASREFRNLTANESGCKRCYFLIISTVIVLKKAILHSAVLVAEKHPDGGNNYFYFESVADRPNERYAPMHFYEQLRGLPDFDQIKIVFGNQVNDRHCLQRCVDFIATSASTTSSIRHDDIYPVGHLSRGEAGFLYKEVSEGEEEEIDDADGTMKPLTPQTKCISKLNGADGQREMGKKGKNNQSKFVFKSVFDQCKDLSEVHANNVPVSSATNQNVVAEAPIRQSTRSRTKSKHGESSDVEVVASKQQKTEPIVNSTYDSVRSNKAPHEQTYRPRRQARTVSTRPKLRALRQSTTYSLKPAAVKATADVNENVSTDANSEKDDKQLSFNDSSFLGKTRKRKAADSSDSSYFLSIKKSVNTPGHREIKTT